MDSQVPDFYSKELKKQLTYLHDTCVYFTLEDPVDLGIVRAIKNAAINMGNQNKGPNNAVEWAQLCITIVNAVIPRIARLQQEVRHQKADKESLNKVITLMREDKKQAEELIKKIDLYNFQETTMRRTFLQEWKAMKDLCNSLAQKNKALRIQIDELEYKNSVLSTKLVSKIN